MNIPRIDAVTFSVPDPAGLHEGESVEVVLAFYARGLEQENARLEAHAERQANAIDQFTVEVARQAEEIKRLRGLFERLKEAEMIFDASDESEFDVSQLSLAVSGVARAALAPNATGKHT